MTEPLSCCFEAFRHCVPAKRADGSLIPGREVKRLLIVGDGPSALLLALTALIFFPDCAIFVVGKSSAKLNAIQRLSTERVHTLVAGDATNRLEQLLAGNKIDVAVPTFGGVDVIMSEYRHLVEGGAMLIVWAASHAAEKVDKHSNIQVHHSYGGWNQAEWSAVQFWNALCKHRPPLLEVVCSYPYLQVDITEAGRVLQQWFDNNFKLNRDLDGLQTSAKIVINHFSAAVAESQ
jgi:threonine dehydrogenase-like Zn-dependent dehydrogenase